MTSILTDSGLVFAQALDWVLEVCQAIVSEPFLLLGTCLMVTGFVFGLLRRAIIKG